MNIKHYRDQIKIVFFDIDDTLYLKHQDHLPDSIQPAIQQLKANGIIPAIATGRTYCAFPPVLQRLISEENIEALVTMNGQYVSYQHKTVKKYPLAKADLLRLTQFFQQQQIEYAFITQQEILVSNINPPLENALNPITKNYRLNEDPDYLLHNDIFQLLAFYPQQQDQLIADSHILQNVKTVRWHEDSVDIFDAKGSKARGIRAMLEHLGLDMQQAMAFGDGLNDIEMLQEVGVGIAMGNAHEQLKQQADYVTDTVAEHGIANFLSKAGLI
ncbi:Cof-type HAD-IIB family hydrolase [Volucribacter amazonae]|uniref:Hydrolase n=1 Tax=Volucribacter amazonae TaxID=256731 RepID=A0A9X4SI06_9PAST|nr:Cof-type HAD-IIB family hydrolase [Volucribacter amazonae]MDG6895167.1 hydrolase [Volucribacter amazonae]